VLWTMKRVCLMCAVAVFTLVSMAVSADANENATAEGVPTFNADVAPILYENCAVCHRAGQVAPMTLTSYAEVRPWARAIKGKVISREMPPWFADPRYGNFQDVPTLSQAEIDTIAAWADGGAPQGAGPAPDAPVFVSEWGHDRQPDFVLDQPELHLPAQGELAYVKLWLDNPWKEDVYLEAVQMRPGNPGVVHHTGVFSRALPPGTKIGEKRLYPGGQMIPQPVPIDENESAEAKVARAETVANGNDGLDSQLVFYTPGRGFNKYPEGTGKRVHADRYIMFNSHYTLTGRPEVDNSKAGFWFSKEQPHHQVLTVSSGRSGGSGPVRIVEGTEQLGASESSSVAAVPVIPPNVDDFKVTGIWPVTDDVTIYGVWPHMHFRGKDMTYIISYPDGTEVTMLNVPNYDFNWQLEYDFVEPLKVPAGSTIKTVGHYDNSVKNRYNPAPDNEVYWGEQSWDEMFMIFTKYSIDKLDLSLENQPATQD
jgi:mono/diheme cytochrome c family protein